MKHFKRRHMAVLPLLSILSMSPSMIESKFHGRHIASIEIAAKTHPKYEAIASKIDRKELYKNHCLESGHFRVIRNELVAKVAKAKEEFKKEQSDKEIVSEQRKKLENLIRDVVVIENDFSDLKENRLSDEELNKETIKLLVESKDTVEGLLAELAANEALVAKASEVKKEEQPVVVVEVKKEEAKPEAKVDSKQEKLEAELCAAQDQNKLLTDKMDTLIQQQSMVMQAMLGMTQMMFSMAQRQNQYQPTNLQIQNPYQYSQPYTAGNWVYLPQGQMQLQQPQAPTLLGGFYPDQIQYNSQSNWGLLPQNYFGTPGLNPQPTMPGTFGGGFGPGDGYSFNLNNMNGSNALNSMNTFSNVPSFGSGHI